MNEEINEFVEREQELESIKNSDQLFIQENYKKMSLEDLCNATLLSPETITSYIEEYDEYLSQNGINPDKKFVFAINMDSVGNISYSIEWPDPKSVDKMLPFVGKLFFLINSGSFKSSMANFLGKYAEQKGSYTLVKKIMEDWNKFEKENREHPIVEPHEVFKE